MDSSDVMVESYITLLLMFCHEVV